MKFFDINQGILTLKNDETLIEEDVTIPKNFIVKIYSGQKIKLINNSLILSYSPWIAMEKTLNQNNWGQKKFLEVVFL